METFLFKEFVFVLHSTSGNRSSVVTTPLIPLDKPKWVWPVTNWHNKLFVPTSTPTPSMHKKLTKHGKFCLQNNQLPTTPAAELKGNSSVSPSLWRINAYWPTSHSSMKMYIIVYDFRFVITTLGIAVNWNMLLPNVIGKSLLSILKVEIHLKLHGTKDSKVLVLWRIWCCHEL